MNPRPYLNLRGQSLVELYQRSVDDAAVLLALSDELSNRNVPRMRSLKLDVDAALVKLGRERPLRSAAADSPSQPDSIAKARLLAIDGEAVEADSGSFYDEGDTFGRTDNDVDQTSAAEKLAGLLGGMIRPCGRLHDVPSRWTP